MINVVWITERNQQVNIEEALQSKALFFTESINQLGCHDNTWPAWQKRYPAWRLLDSRGEALSHEV